MNVNYFSKKILPVLERRILACGLALLLLLSIVPAAAAEPQIPPKPGPNEFNYVFDYAHILTPQDIDKISGLGRELDQQTKAQVVVVTVDSIGNSTIEEYANKLFRSWGLGDRDKNNGVLLLINKENMLTGEFGKLRIEVGYGLEGAIPDGVAGRIRDNYILPRWAQKQYSEGVLQGYLAIAGQVAKEYNISLAGNYDPIPLNAGSGKPLSGPVVGLIVAVAFLAMFGSIANRRRRRRWRNDDDDFGGFGGWGGGGFFGGGGFGGGSGGGFGGFGGGSSGGGGASG